MSLTLGINTASSVTTLVLIKNGVLVDSVFWLSSNDEAEKLMPEIDRMLKSDYSDLSEVFVVRGPGSFTGLRVGVTVANTLAYLTGARLFAFSTFDYWKVFSGGRTVVVFAGKGAIYFYDEDYKIVNLEDLEGELSAAGEVFGDVSEEQRGLLGEHYVHHDEQWDKQLADAYRTLRPAIEEQKQVKPLYVKRPGITMRKVE